jgi:tRNA 5-methylaminomethyl-2-thiouridine biosynthesis bifunctional protein
LIGAGALQRAARHAPGWHVIVLGDDTPLQSLFPDAGPHHTLPGLQRFATAGGGTLTYGRGDMLALLRQLSANVDAFHVSVDARPPGAALFRQLARLARPAALLHLQGGPLPWPIINNAGFEQTGAATARYRGGPHRRAREPFCGERHAIVIGAGLAGTAAASSLSSRGFRVTLIDAAAGLAMAASGNLAGVISPMISKDDNRSARLSRASFYALLRELETLGHHAQWSGCGVMQLAKDAQDETLLAEIVAARPYPADFCQFLSREDASRQFNVTAPAGGVYFPHAGWVNPPSLCQARIRTAARIEHHFNTPISHIKQLDGQWQVCAHGHVVAQAPILVLAHSAAAAKLPQAAALHFKTVRGQLTYLQHTPLPELNVVWQRDGYLTPPIAGVRCLGATYDFDNAHPDLLVASHEKNLARLRHLLPGVAFDANPADLPGRVAFRALTIDRLPLVGALPDVSAPLETAEPQLHRLPRFTGLYGLLGLGSRGITWSVLAGEILASLINAEPLPVEQDLADAIDPARFWLRALRAQHSSAPHA